MNSMIKDDSVLSGKNKPFTISQRVTLMQGPHQSAQICIDGAWHELSNYEASRLAVALQWIVLDNKKPK